MSVNPIQEKTFSPILNPQLNSNRNEGEGKILSTI